MALFVKDPPYYFKGQRSFINIADEFICLLCKQPQKDPRLLPCLHSFCLECLENYIQLVPKNRSDSVVSGYESDVEVITPKCPNCKSLFTDNITNLPVNYILQHRMLIASINSNPNVPILCDICPHEISATDRCSICLISMCKFCTNLHKSHCATSRHEVLSLREPLKAVRRDILCAKHSNKYLNLYCVPCDKIICKECAKFDHTRHNIETLSQPFKNIKTKIQNKLGKLRNAKCNIKEDQHKFDNTSRHIELKCSDIEKEIDNFIDLYIDALQEHRKRLKIQVKQECDAKLKVLKDQKENFDHLVSNLGLVEKFSDDLLNEGSEIEVLSLATMLIRKLDESLNAYATRQTNDFKILETINFLPDEKAGFLLNKQMFGVVTTQSVSPEHSSLTPNGIIALNNCRQLRNCEIILITRDCNNQPMFHGGENVVVDVRYRDVTQRSLPVALTDREDGTYSLSFTPDSPGNMVLSILINGTPIKGSPYSVCVRTIRPHHGTFHCCSFCSGKGRKEVTCGCGGTMPGGFRGCGHGHSGHPGRRHWSCCASVLQNSECTRPPPATIITNNLFHFTL